MAHALLFRVVTNGKLLQTTAVFLEVVLISFISECHKLVTKCTLSSLWSSKALIHLAPMRSLLLQEVHLRKNFFKALSIWLHSGKFTHLLYSWQYLSHLLPLYSVFKSKGAGISEKCYCPLSYFKNGASLDLEGEIFQIKIIYIVYIVLNASYFLQCIQTKHQADDVINNTFH